MAQFEQSIEVDVPARVAYEQWTQFEDFPQFMEGVESVRQIDDSHLHWRADIAGTEQEWDAEITEQIPDKRIAWRSLSGARNAGVVTFHRVSDRQCRVMLQLEYEPQTITESMGDLLGLVSRRVDGDLERFKAFIENRQTPTGAWRGEIASPDDRRQ
jgi:uncharacterized membrane protein